MIRSWLFCCFCLLPCILFAHEGLRFRFLELPASLRDVSITHVAEDRAGMLWFSTSSGLHRYDGNRLLTFDLLSQPALISNAIGCLLADKHDRIWAGTSNGLTMIDLLTWKATSWIHRPGTKENLVVRYVYEGQDSSIYIISGDAALYRVDGGKLVQAADFRALLPKDNIQLGGVFEPVKGELWVLVNGRFVIVRQQKMLRHFPAVAMKAAITDKVFFHKSGRVVFNVTGDGVYIGNMATGEVSRWKHPLNDSLTSRRKVNFFHMPDGNVGIFINKYGFISFDPVSGQTQEPEPEVMQHFTNISMSLYRGREGRHYFGFNRGIAVLETVLTPFRNYLGTASSETVPYSVRSLYQLADNTWLIGNYKDGLTLFDEKSGQAKQLAQRFVYTMIPWSKDTLLAATEGDGLHWLNIPQRTLTPLHSSPTGGFAAFAKYTTSLYRENDSLVWAGTYAGLSLLNVYTGRTMPVPAISSQQRIMTAKIFQVMAKGPLRYIATTAGLFIYNTAAGTVRKAAEDQPETGVYCLLEVNGRIWAGTNGRGILVLDAQGKLLETLTTTNGLAGNAVYALLADGGYVAAGTGHGLSLVRTKSFAIRNYSRLDKLPSSEFNHSAALQSNGRMYFGTINGFTSFSLSQLLAADTTKRLPPVYFTSFTSSNNNGQVQDFTLPYKMPRSLEIQPGTEYFSLRFGGPGQEEVKQLQYFYRLKEEEWKEIGRQPEISFAGLAPGKYLVQLAARITPGNPVQPLLSLPLTVFPAWYQTWWFRIMAVLLAAVTVWLIWRYRMQQLRKEQQLRTKIAGDLHDEVGSSLTRIYFQADLLRMKEEHTPALQKIADTSRDALTTMSDMVWSIDARFDTAADLVSRMRDYVVKLQQDLGLSCNFQVTGHYAERALSQMIRQNFFLIFKEAVNNAARYTAGDMNITLHFGQQLALTVQNPFDEHADEHARPIKTYQGGQGLQHMRMRAERMKGTLETGPQNGFFVVKLSVPW